MTSLRTIPETAFMTNAELIIAIEGYRMQLDNFAMVTSANLKVLTEALVARRKAGTYP